MATDRQRVSIELTVEQASAVQGWLAAQGSMVQYENQIGKVQKASERAAKSSQDAWDQTGSAITRMIGSIDLVSLAWRGVQTAGQLVREEIEGILAKQTDAANFLGGEFATAQRKAFEAMGQRVGFSPADLEKRIAESGALTPKGEQYLSAAAAFKEGGLAFDTERIVETGRQAELLAGRSYDSSTRQRLAAAGVDLQKKFPELSPGQSIANLIQADRQSESDLGQLSESLVPAMVRSKAYTGKTSLGDLQGFFLGLQDRMDTDIGQATSVGEKFLNTLEMEGTKAGAFKKGASLDEQLAATKGNTALQKKVLARFRAGAPGTREVRELFDPTSETSQAIAAMRKETGGTPAEALGREQQFQEQLDVATPGQQTADLKRRQKAFTEAALSREKRASAGALRATVSEQEKEMGLPDLDRWLSDRALALQLEGQPVARQREIARAGLRQTAQMVAEDRPAGLFNMINTEDDRQIARDILKNLDELIPILKDGQGKPIDVNLPPNAAARPVPAQGLRE